MKYTSFIYAFQNTWINKDVYISIFGNKLLTKPHIAANFKIRYKMKQ